MSNYSFKSSTFNLQSCMLILQRSVPPGTINDKRNDGPKHRTSQSFHFSISNYIPKWKPTTRNNTKHYPVYKTFHKLTSASSMYSIRSISYLCISILVWIKIRPLTQTWLGIQFTNLQNFLWKSTTVQKFSSFFIKSHKSCYYSYWWYFRTCTFRTCTTVVINNKKREKRKKANVAYSSTVPYQVLLFFSSHNFWRNFFLPFTNRILVLSSLWKVLVVYFQILARSKWGQ